MVTASASICLSDHPGYPGSCFSCISLIATIFLAAALEKLVEPETVRSVPIF
jgi:hypothetical protein